MKKIVLFLNRVLLLFLSKRALESFYIYSLKSLQVNLLYHAHIQLGFSGFNDLEATGEVGALQAIKKILKGKPLMFFDIGANDGTYSLELKKYFPDAAIKAFEPMPSTYQVAFNNLKQKAGVTLLQLGLSDQPGTLLLYNDANNPNSQISTTYPEGLKDFYKVESLSQVEIEVTTIDNYCLMENITQIDFVKVDVEGGELKVLKGGENIIKNGKVNVIQFEFNDFNIVSRTFMKDFYDLLSGYTFYRISKNVLIPLGPYKVDLEIFKFQNVLAIRDTNEFKLDR